MWKIQAGSGGQDHRSIIDDCRAARYSNHIGLRHVAEGRNHVRFGLCHRLQSRPADCTRRRLTKLRMTQESSRYSFRSLLEPGVACVGGSRRGFCGPNPSRVSLLPCRSTCVTSPKARIVRTRPGANAFGPSTTWRVRGRTRHGPDHALVARSHVLRPWLNSNRLAPISSDTLAWPTR